jgi:hypothetical protein
MAQAMTGTREERVAVLRRQWEHFQDVFKKAIARGDWELATNARGSLSLIARELHNLGEPVPEGPAGPLL